MKIDYVILSTDSNPLYYEFWDVMKKIWIEHIGIKPILVRLSDKDEIIDNNNHIIHNLKSVQSIDTGFQSQICRMFVTKFYPNKTCLISDIDMLPINIDYFNNTTKQFDENSMVIFSSDAYAGSVRYPMCYNAAKGGVFSEILSLDDYNFESYVNKLVGRNEGWDTDELYFSECVNTYQGNIKIVKLNRGWISGHAVKRIDRTSWVYDREQIHTYIDSHLIRPYSSYSKEINELISLILNK